MPAVVAVMFAEASPEVDDEDAPQVPFSVVDSVPDFAALQHSDVGPSARDELQKQTAYYYFAAIPSRVAAVEIASFVDAVRELLPVAGSVLPDDAVDFRHHYSRVDYYDLMFFAQAQLAQGPFVLPY